MRVEAKTSGTRKVSAILASDGKGDREITFLLGLQNDSATFSATVAGRRKRGCCQRATEKTDAHFQSGIPKGHQLFLLYAKV